MEREGETVVKKMVVYVKCALLNRSACFRDALPMVWRPGAIHTNQEADVHPFSTATCLSVSLIS